ncbi:MAG: EAL domain-containing protein [Bacilli bacterium]|jgi:EAL domain-containing protein (putative c-di-GMP-specific phosphodiesterase class I)
MENKTSQGPAKVPNYTLRFIIFLSAFFVVFALDLLDGFGVFAFFGDVGKWILFAFLTGGSIALLILSLLSFSQSQKVTVKKIINTDIFPLIDNVNDERELVMNVNKLLKKKSGEKSAAVTFSTFRFKKEVFLRYGYQKESDVISTIFFAIENLKETNPKIIYGYDYSDNFMLYVPDITENKINLLLEKLTNVINKLLGDNNISIDFYPHYGVRLRNDENIAAETMFQTALIASDYGRLSSERGGIFIFNDSMFSKNERNVSLARDIERGLEAGEFEVYFQPKYDLKLKRFSGAEALLRWHHPERGTILPAAFIALAEQSDLIIHIDHYVFDRVCMHLSHWRDKGQRLLPISVNLSKRTVFTADIADYIEKTIKKYQVSPLLLEVEIVESPSPYDVLYLLSTVKKIKALNIKVAIDDFGTGFSSLSYIKRIPFDVIKIDRAFLSDLEIDYKSRGLVKEIIKLAHVLETYVIIEGVQEYEQIKLLQSMDADCIQGFYYSEPLRPEDYLRFISDNKYEKTRRAPGT